MIIIINKNKKKTETTGKKWFDMPAPEITPEVKLDLQLIKMRNVLDRKRHYKKDDTKGLPKYFQVSSFTYMINLLKEKYRNYKYLKIFLI